MSSRRPTLPAPTVEAIVNRRVRAALGRTIPPSRAPLRVCMILGPTWRSSTRIYSASASGVQLFNRRPTRTIQPGSRGLIQGPSPTLLESATHHFRHSQLSTNLEAFEADQGFARSNDRPIGGGIRPLVFPKVRHLKAMCAHHCLDRRMRRLLRFRDILSWSNGDSRRFRLRSISHAGVTAKPSTIA